MPFHLAKNLVLVHVELQGCWVMKNVSVAFFKSKYRNGATMPYVDYVAQRHEEGSVIRKWLLVATTSIYCKI